jgi:transposase
VVNIDVLYAVSIWLLPVLIAVTFHEAAHGYVARFLGDDTASRLGRAVMTREVYYRQFDNRRQVAGFLGLATSPHDSGDVERSQGISRAGRGQVRGTIMVADCGSNEIGPVRIKALLHH